MGNQRTSLPLSKVTQSIHPSRTCSSVSCVKTSLNYFKQTFSVWTHLVLQSSTRQNVLSGQGPQGHRVVLYEVCWKNWMNVWGVCMHPLVIAWSQLLEVNGKCWMRKSCIHLTFHPYPWAFPWWNVKPQPWPLVFIKVLWELWAKVLWLTCDRNVLVWESRLSAFWEFYIHSLNSYSYLVSSRYKS